MILADHFRKTFSEESEREIQMLNTRNCPAKNDILIDKVKVLKVQKI